MSKPADSLPRFTVRAGSMMEASNLIAAASTVFIHEGLKSLAARRALGLDEPRIEGKPLGAFVSSEFANGTELMARSAFLGRRTGLGALWIAQNLPGAPDEAFASDADVFAVICRTLGREAS